MSDSQVWAVLHSAPLAGDFGWSVITRSADSTHWAVYINGVSQETARQTADALNAVARAVDDAGLS